MKEARNIIAKALSLNSEFVTIQIDFTAEKLLYSEANTRGPKFEVFNFGDFSKIEGYTQGATYRIDVPNKYFLVWNIYRTDEGVARVANAFYRLKQNALKHKEESKTFKTQFSESLDENRKKANSAFELPPVANKYKIQAEGSVKDKEFLAAEEYYWLALKSVPWWPAGHFNRALILGESKDYEEAITSMEYYLQLVPKASNAKAAQAKIYEWERLAAK